MYFPIWKFGLPNKHLSYELTNKNYSQPLNEHINGGTEVTCLPPDKRVESPSTLILQLVSN